jgi:glycerophosphoryl diester phosphodiesterase
LRELRTIHAEASTGFITERQSALRKWEALDVNFVIPQYKLVSRSLVDEVHAANKQVIVWTVNEQGDMQTMADLHVDGIISDDTHLLCRSFGGVRAAVDPRFG